MTRAWKMTWNDAPNDNKVYEKELKKLKEQIRMYSAKNKFYFFLENPLNNESEIDINNNWNFLNILFEKPDIVKAIKENGTKSKRSKFIFRQRRGI